MFLTQLPMLLAFKRHQVLNRTLETNAVKESEHTETQKELHIPVMLDEVLHYLLDTVDNFQVQRVQIYILF
jgi:hypothetical protein